MPWSGVVDGSLWNISVTTKNKECVITAEEYQPPVDNHDLKLLRQVQVSGDIIQGRVLSWPKAICRQGNILVSQFVTHKNPYIQFLVIDLVKETCFAFCDTVRHFRRSYALMGSVECCLSPDLHMMLLRLPRVVARAHTASLALVARARCPTRPMGVVDNPVDVTDRFRFQDRKLCMLLFDPRFPRRLVSMQVSEFCTKCLVLSRDQETETTILKKSLLLGQLSASQISVAENSLSHDDFNEDSDDSDDAYDPLLVFKTVSCKAEYSRNADRIVLCCFVEDSLHGGMYARVFVFDADNFSCIAKYFQSLDPGDPSEAVSVFQIVFSPCDTRVHVMLPSSDQAQLLCSIDIRNPVSLRNFCRSCILSSMSDARDVAALPLPPSLKKYLQFRLNKYVEKVSESEEN
ncbi:uncharacterized protein [Littorina saxatilis]